jgi:hypothetical protein
MARTNYKVFLSDLLKRGNVLKGSSFCDYFGSSYYHLAANSKDVELIRDMLSKGGGDIIEMNGAHYSVTHEIVCDQPFNVTGFTGDFSDISKEIDCLDHDIKLLQVSVSSFLKMTVDVGKSYGHKYPVDPDNAARRLYEYWYSASVGYIEKHLAYNLIADSGCDAFDTNNADYYWSDILNNDRFYCMFESFDDLTRLPGLLDFNKLLAYIEKQFNEDAVNLDFIESAASKLTWSYVNKASYKVFDKYKLSYSSCYVGILEHKFNDWLEALEICCKEQDKMSFYNDFFSDFKREIGPLNPGDSVVCGGVSVHVYKEHITLSLPKDITAVIGVFVNKYNADGLAEMAG